MLPDDHLSRLADEDTADGIASLWDDDDDPEWEPPERTPTPRREWSPPPDLRILGHRGATVLAEYGTAASPGWSYSESAEVQSTPETRDPRWWRARVGDVGLRLTVYPRGRGDAERMAEGRPLGQWRPGEEPGAPVELPATVLVLAGTVTVRATLSPQRVGDRPVYVVVPIDLDKLRGPR